MKRNQEREQAFALIFEKTFRNDSIEEILEDAISAEAYTQSDYTERCFKGVFDKIDELDALISDNLTGWKIERISKVALCILRLAIFEMNFVEEVPVGVAINEAVELAKKYTTSDDASFINGVLGSISRA